MYWYLYAVFGLMFVGGVVAYWVVSSKFKGMNDLESEAGKGAVESKA